MTGGKHINDQPLAISQEDKKLAMADGNRSPTTVNLE